MVTSERSLHKASGSGLELGTCKKLHIVAGATKPRISKMLNFQESQKTWRL